MNSPVICVPSGNFGNICAGIFAHISGLPVQHFIAACNANNTVPEFLQTGNYQPKPAVATISNAMDVGNPSNFIRILELFQHQLPQLKEKVSSFTVSDEETKQTLSEVYKNYQYTLDPHGAVAYQALNNYLQNNDDWNGILLETAHPVKFPDVVEAVTGSSIAVPDSAVHLLKLEKKSIHMNADFDDLKEWLLNK